MPKSTQPKRGTARIGLGACKTPNPAALSLFHPRGAEPSDKSFEGAGREERHQVNTESRAAKNVTREPCPLPQAFQRSPSLSHTPFQAPSSLPQTRPWPQSTYRSQDSLAVECLRLARMWAERRVGCPGPCLCCADWGATAISERKQSDVGGVWGYICQWVPLLTHLLPPDSAPGCIMPQHPTPLPPSFGGCRMTSGWKAVKAGVPGLHMKHPFPFM